MAAARAEVAVQVAVRATRRQERQQQLAPVKEFARRRAALRPQAVLLLALAVRGLALQRRVRRGQLAPAPRQAQAMVKTETEKTRRARCRRVATAEPALPAQRQVLRPLEAAPSPLAERGPPRWVRRLLAGFP
jgi:hypothetical protein